MTLSQIRKERANMGMLDGLKNLVGNEDEEDLEEQENTNRSRNLRIVKPQAKISLCKVLMFEDAATIANAYLDGSSVILNFENTDKGITKRVLDFLSGVAFAVDGSINQVAEHSYIMTNANVSVQKEGLYDYADYSTI